MRFVNASVAKNHHLVNINVKQLDDKWATDKDFYIGSQGKHGIKGRYERFGEFLKNEPDTAIEASIVNVDNDGGVFFDNGRHRFAYLRDMGFKSLPVSMDDISLKNAKRFGYLSESLLESLLNCL